MPEVRPELRGSGEQRNGDHDKNEHHSGEADCNVSHHRGILLGSGSAHAAGESGLLAAQPAPPSCPGTLVGRVDATLLSSPD